MPSFLSRLPAARALSLGAGALLLAGGLAVPVIATSQMGPLLVTVTSSPNPYAIAGTTSVASSSGVRGIGTASGDIGVFGDVAAGSGAGVEGFASATSTASPSAGVLGYSRAGVGVIGASGSAQSFEDDNIGVFGVGFDGTYGMGVSVGAYGDLRGTSRAGQTEPEAAAVYGMDNTSNSTQAGMYGFTENGVGAFGYSDTYIGVLGFSGGDGVYAFGSGGAKSDGVYALGGIGVDAETVKLSDGGTGVSALAGNASSTAVFASATGSHGVGLEIAASGDAATPIEVTGAAPAAASAAAAASPAPILTLDQSGNLTIAGTLTQGNAPVSVARDARGAGRVVYSPQEAEATIEDVGEARLSGGRAEVPLDPAFAALIDRSTPYLVFITPEGVNGGYYVAARTAAGFEVRDQSGRGSMPFAYRIVARPEAARRTERLAAYVAPAVSRAAVLAARASNERPRRHTHFTPLAIPRVPPQIPAALFPGGRVMR